MFRKLYKKVIPILIFLLTCPIINASGMDPLYEYKAKSIMIYSICKFTEWPSPKDGPSNQPLVFSVLGKLPPGSKIDLPPKRKIRDRKIVLKNIKELEEIDGSDILFITRSEADHIREIMDYVGDKAILSIGENIGLGSKGVTFNILINTQGSLKFEINREAIDKAGLKVHAQLYQLGKLVKTSPQSTNKNKVSEF
jgi:hypothetical protein